MAKDGYKKNDRVGDWKLIDLLGSGGQGQVWSVRHAQEHHSPRGALKLCSAADEKARARFAREVDILRKQKHPGLVSVRDAGDQDGVPFFVMERANGSMERLVTADSAGVRLLRESPALLLSLFQQACAGVAHLHQQGLLHRDIKPSNILLMLEPPEPMRAVVADLGIAAAIGEQGALTATQEVVGTPAFRAPESLKGSHLASSDVYSLGKTLEFLFTRVVPMDWAPGRCLRGPALSNELWDELDSILESACAFKVEDRYQDAGEFVAALPRVVLVRADCRGGGPPKTAAAADVSLGWREARVLAAVIGACPTESDGVTSFDLARRTRMSDYAFAMGLRELRRVGFIDAETRDGSDDNTWEVFTPSASGLDWARAHPEEMERPTETEVADDDIPF